MDDAAGRLIPAPLEGEKPRPVIFLSVGEPSGDLHGAALARALRARVPGVRLIGLGGPAMAAEGVELLADLKDLAVMGFVEVLSRLRFFLKLRDRVFAALASEKVDLVIPVDYPGFNLRLAKHAKAAGIPVLYYIAPQVWAWHSSRARDIARDTDRVAVILPFEADFLAKNGAIVEFVGHPLLDVAPLTSDRASWLQAQGLSAEKPLLALFPGSRRQELDRHLEIFAAAARALQQTHPNLQVLLAAASGIPLDAYGRAGFPTTNATGELLGFASAAIVKSGTTTLEAALAETPFVVAYRMNRGSWQVARRLVKVPHIALANLVAEKRVVPELIQDEVTPARLAAAVAPLLDEASPRRREVVEGLRQVRGALKRGGAGERVAEIAAELIAQRAS